MYRVFTEIGNTRMVSSPRISRTRPLRPVRMTSPGFSGSSCLSETCAAPAVVTHTSPEDLLIDHTPSSPAKALALATLFWRDKQPNRD
jgi:hypothetical protein